VASVRQRGPPGGAAAREPRRRPSPQLGLAAASCPGAERRGAGGDPGVGARRSFLRAWLRRMWPALAGTGASGGGASGNRGRRERGREGGAVVPGRREEMRERELSSVGSIFGI
jgi:hypothetical protein